MLRKRTLPSSFPSLALMTPLLLGVLSGSWVAGCSGGNEEPEAIPADEVVPRATPQLEQAPSLLDADGRLLPSERVLGGLTLPRGLENEQQGNNRHLFEIAVPATTLVQYLGPRLLTGQVEPSGTGATFINALPLRPTGTAFHMDVMVTERGSNASSLIIRLTDAPTARPSAPTPEDLAEYHEHLD